MRIFSGGKNCASSSALDFVAASGFGGDIKTTFALARRFLGSAASVSKTWFTAPSRFCATIIGVARKADDQIPRIKIFAERSQQAARAFHQRHVEIFPRHAEVREDGGKLHRFVFQFGGERRRDGRAEMPGVDFIQRQRASSAARNLRASSRPPEQTGLNAADVYAARAQKMRQQRGQNGFADAGVRAGDEECWLHFADIKAESAHFTPPKQFAITPRVIYAARLV